MANNTWNRQSLQTYLRRGEYQLKKVAKEAWPINWDNFRKPSILLGALVESSYAIKSIFTISCIGLVVSLCFLAYGTYLSTTIEIAAEGGTIQEAVVGGDLKLFNPVFEPNSEGETKIDNLLYSPLYTVKYPDFLANPTATAEINPVLLSKSPEWTDAQESNPQNRFKHLRFTLKDNIKWSNGKAITIDDIDYTLQRLQEDKGNSQFRSVLSKVTLSRVDGLSNQFDLISDTSAPQLIYAANFLPISKDYYNSQSTTQLLSDPRSFKPIVTSGYFTFADGTVTDPDNSNGGAKENPIRDTVTNTIKTIVLKRNPVQNNSQGVYPDTYILRHYDTVLDSGGANSSSLERGVKDNKVDLYSRFVGTSMNLNPSDLRDKVGLQQTIVPSNTFYNLYLNIKINDYFINQTLRKYVVCQFLNYHLRDFYQDKLVEIPTERRLIPIQLNQTAQVDCPAPEKILEQAKTPAGDSIYTITSDPKTNIKRVLVFGKPITNFSLVGLPESEPLLTDIQRFFLDIGIPADLINDSRASQAISDKNYNAAFLPITLASPDLYPIYGSSGQNLSQINQNNRVLDYKVEDNLKSYSVSNLTDQNAKKSLVDFFSKEFISVNLFQAQNEIDYSTHVVNINKDIPQVITFLEDYYQTAPNWYLQTKRKFR